MIEVENLTKYYGAVPAVRDVTFNVEPGEILGFLGPNGAGKTTTMRIITGYVPATAGTVRVGGYDVAEKSMLARAHLGYLPETVPLYTELTPMEYLDFKGRISGMHNARERRERIWDVMVELNLTDVANKLIGALSRGYRQRVGLAQAMLHNPDVLILDEPTVGLDPVQITEVRDLIRRLGENHTIILSTHLLPEVSMVCNRVIIINRGRLVALDTPFHLAGEQTAVVSVEALGPADDVLSAIRGIPGVLSADLDGTGGDRAAQTSLIYRVQPAGDSDVRPEIASALVSAGYGLVELKEVRPSLEEIFLQIITQDQAVEEEVPELQLEEDELENLEEGDDYEEDSQDELEVAAPGQSLGRGRRTSEAIRTRRRTRR
jgi:ABC-2 type transport system ATP-binding protein